MFAPAQPSQRLARECRYWRRITQDACASSAEMQARYRRIPPFVLTLHRTWGGKR